MHVAGTLDVDADVLRIYVNGSLNADGAPRATAARLDVDTERSVQRYGARGEEPSLRQRPLSPLPKVGQNRRGARRRRLRRAREIDRR
jgi:hypothetical protein